MTNHELHRAQRALVNDMFDAYRLQINQFSKQEYKSRFEMLPDIEETSKLGLALIQAVKAANSLNDYS